MWIVASVVGVAGLLGAATFLGFLPMLAPVFGAVLSVFFKIIEALLSTRIGVALLTAVVVAAIVYPLGNIRGRHGIAAEWAAADASATLAAKSRDARIAAEAVADAQAENDAIKQTSDELSKKVAEYETELAKRTPTDSCVLNPDDVRRLRDITGGKPKATGKH